MFFIFLALAIKEFDTSFPVVSLECATRLFECPPSCVRCNFSPSCVIVKLTPISISQSIADLLFFTQWATASLSQIPSPTSKVSAICSSTVSFSPITAAIPPWAYQVELSTMVSFEITDTLCF